MPEACTSLAEVIRDFNPDTFNKVVLALVALIAMVVGPGLQWSIAKRQVQLQREIARRQAADNVSAKRQNWIDELRKDMAEYLAVVARLNELRRPGKGLSPELEAKNFEEMARYSFEGMELAVRIKLRLNPNENDHNWLAGLLTDLSLASADPPANETDEQRKATQKAFKKALDDVISHMQAILKREWERVKKGEL